MLAKVLDFSAIALKPSSSPAVLSITFVMVSSYSRVMVTLNSLRLSPSATTPFVTSVVVLFSVSSFRLLNIPVSLIAPLMAVSYSSIISSDRENRFAMSSR